MLESASLSDLVSLYLIFKKAALTELPNVTKKIKTMSLLNL